MCAWTHAQPKKEPRTLPRLLLVPTLRLTTEGRVHWPRAPKSHSAALAAAVSGGLKNWVTRTLLNVLYRLRVLDRELIQSRGDIHTAK
jgi:hypothetical protein